MIMSNIEEFNQLQNVKEEIDSLKDQIIDIDKKISNIKHRLSITDINLDEKNNLISFIEELKDNKKILMFNLLSIEYYMLCNVSSDYIPASYSHDLDNYDVVDYVSRRKKSIIKKTKNIHEIVPPTYNEWELSKIMNRKADMKINDSEILYAFFLHNKLLYNASKCFELPNMIISDNTKDILGINNNVKKHK